MRHNYAPNAAGAPADGTISTAKLADGAVTTAKLAAGGVTGAKIGPAAVKNYAFTGRNGAGNITVTGLAVGDRLQFVYNETDDADATASFTSPVTVTDTLAQSSGIDLSAKKFVMSVLIATA
jgi:hypothetical protein